MSRAQRPSRLAALGSGHGASLLGLMPDDGEHSPGGHSEEGSPYPGSGSRQFSDSPKSSQQVPKP